MPQTGMIEDPPFLDDEERDAIRAADDSLGHRGAAAHDKDFAARKDRIEASARATLTSKKRSRLP